MQLIHWFMAILAAFRLVDVFVADAIWQPVRQRWPQVPWHCIRCMSIWAGIVATVLCAWVPWLNWPLAISWIYLAYGDWMLQRGPKERVIS